MLHVPLNARNNLPLMAWMWGPIGLVEMDVFVALLRCFWCMCGGSSDQASEAGDKNIYEAFYHAARGG